MKEQSTRRGPVCHAKGKFQEFTTAQLKGTKTEQNLKNGFAGESQAHTKYLYFASKAKKEGYEQIGWFVGNCLQQGANTQNVV